MSHEYQAPGTRSTDFEGAFDRLSQDEQAVVVYVVGSQKAYKSLEPIEREVMDKFLDMSDLTIHQGVMDKSMADRY